MDGIDTTRTAGFARHYLRNPLGMAALVLLVLLLGLALLAPWVAPHDPYAINAETMLSHPGPRQWFGSDQLGRDVLSRVMYGARISFKVGCVSVALALAAGTSLGVLAGYAGRRVDFLVSRVVDGMFAIPDILMALAIMAVLGPKTINVMLAIGIVYTPIFARVARGAVLQGRNALYVEAARSMGVRPMAIIFRHILPDALPPLLVQTSLSFAFAILAEAALSFLGLGVEPDTPSWGVMLNEGKDWMEQAWWIAVFPGLAITLTVFSFNVAGDALRDALDPRLRSGGKP